LTSPLLDVAEINTRLEKVQTFVENPDMRATTRTQLRKLRDVSRALQRLAVGRWVPNDLLLISEALSVARTLSDEVLQGRVRFF